jgi:hypothetical protein
MAYGVLTGRRAGARKEEVLNTLTARQSEAFVEAKRKKTAAR